MGWAILWIMMLHFRFISLKPLGFIAQYGYAGVEIFMFVSGLGLYYSLQRNNSLLSFYAKRLKRIFPTYYIIGVVASVLLFHDGLLAYLWRYSTLGFWTQTEYFEWYVPSILFLYLIAPLAWWLFHRNQDILLLCISVAIAVASYFIAEKQLIDRSHFFLLYRIPAFLFGMYIAKQIKSAGNNTAYYICLLVGIPLFAVLFPKHHTIYEFKYFSVFFLLPTFVLVFCLLSRYLGSAVRHVTALIGNASLEVYLIQTILFTAITQNMLQVSTQYHDVVTLLLIVGCSVAGVALHRLLPW